MTTPSRWFAAALLAVLCAAPDVASARWLNRPSPNGAPVVPEGVQPGLRTADGRACVKQCPDDDLPCDPPAYKQADGRCNTAWH